MGNLARSLAWAVVVVGTSLLPRIASADPIGDALLSKFGSDKASAENAKVLIDKGVHFDATAGLWYANLSGGLSALGDLAGGDTAVSEAARSIGTGRGFVREVRLGINVLGNEAYFDYLSDQLVQIGQEEASSQTDNPLAKQLIQQLVGELRPDLKSILGPKAQVWVKGEYGLLRGAIDNTRVFGARNGQPFFGGRSEPWQTEYFGFEAGLFPDGKQRVLERGTTLALGFFAKYRSFSRPIPLGYSPEAGDAKFFLSDGNVTAVDLGLRVEYSHCATFCFGAEGSMTPMTGVTHLDLGRYGSATGATFAMGGRLEISLPIKAGPLFFGPTLGFRVDLLEPIGFNLNLAFEDTAQKIAIWNPDYFFWGPTLGITGRL